MMKTDILVTGGTIITMDPQRHIICDGAVAIKDDRILEVGPTEQLMGSYEGKRLIDASRKVVMPGLIDGHAHAGHGLIKTMGAGDSETWIEVCRQAYTTGTTESYWYADGALGSLERLKSGTTCGVTFFGGGDSYMRTDHPGFGERHCEAVERTGIREFLIVGPGNPPFPTKYSRWSDGARRDFMVSFEEQLTTCETLVRRWHGQAEGRIRMGMMFPIHYPNLNPIGPTELQDLKVRSQATRDLTRKYGLLFSQDGHSRGTVKFAYENLDTLGPDALLSHATNLTAEEIAICKQTDTKIVHNPSAVMSMTGRCPVPELLDAGVTVMLGSDGVSPDRSYDMFRHMFQCTRYHRRHYRDPSYLPAGKVLEMVTIDAARALGLENEIGSLEGGKKADLILVDMAKPHLYPLNMHAHRIAYFANGSDVDTVIIDGRILMEGRQVTTVDEEEVLDLAQEETERMLDRTQLRHTLEAPEEFWGHTRLPFNRPPW